VSEVRPELSLQASRLPFHLSLIALLWVATLTDLLDYVIPDEVVVTGIVIAVIAAVSTGQLQMIHIWVNWDEVIPGVRGPYLPDWMKEHQHLHGLAWSLAGLLTGGSLIWLIRRISHMILGQPAMGFGDVTLMAMVGAYIGWQPVLVTIALAPLTGMVVGPLIRLATGRSFVAYGPYLAASALIVISTWRWIWADHFSLRDIFSHWPSVLGLMLFSLVTLVALLGALRLFRSLPAERMKR
jgi:leader peptidase (prepilin peptidase)/N-methyltransferase